MSARKQVQLLVFIIVLPAMGSGCASLQPPPRAETARIAQEYHQDYEQQRQAADNEFYQLLAALLGMVR